ncbi:MAG: bacteriohopanetetrol glucosamine biosynthesis glycosyltransferase HpnI [Azospirillaceae bacterium]|nr:bacteriohopanetetrol glucosamine biosynthesis glycosyltransferase HpnI [Azospirillaceae bacterium]
MTIAEGGLVSSVTVFFAWTLMAAACAGSAYALLAAWAVYRFATTPPVAGAAVSPAVTVLKPLHGDEPLLYENLRSFCVQAYPAVQIVFGVSRPDDPAVAVVRRLIDELPQADLVLVVDGRIHGTNLKVSNLINMMAMARHDLLVVADSDMLVAPDYLVQVTAPFADERVGLVTCLYIGRPIAGVWARLGSLFINHGFLPAVLVGKMVGAREGCFGATMALPRAILAQLGGFAAIKDRLADDYALGEAVRRLNRKVVIAPCLVDTVVSEPDFGTLFQRELRWLRTMRLIAPVDMVASALTYPLPVALLGLLLSGLRTEGWAVLGLAFACRLVMVRVIDRVLGLAMAPFWLVPARDLLSFGLLIGGFCGKTVAWRGRRFRVRANGDLILDRDPVT